MTAATSATAPSSSASNQWAQLTFVEVLEDLSSRFIVNLPGDELQRIERICFQVEQAHWFYEDFLRPLNAKLPSLNLRKFSIYILQTASLSVPLIRQYVSSNNDANSSGTIQDLSALGGQTYGLEAAFDEFMKYKTRVPVCGAVLLSEDWKSCVLVKGWKASAAWGFPKGKINQSETHRDCAVRETLEETGFDCSGLLSPESPHWMELNVREQKMRLYIVPGVHKDTVFETQTRKEISKISWFKLSDLPTWKQSQASGGGGLASANAGAKFYLVTPFIGKLKQWIRDNKKRVQIEQGAPEEVEPSAATPNALPAQRLGSSEGPILGSHYSDAAIPSQQHTAAVNSAAIPRPALNGDSATLLAMLQGSSAKPAPPPAFIAAPSNHQSQKPATAVHLADDRLVSQDRPRHYRQPSDAEQTLIQHLQNQRISGPTNPSPLPAPRATKSSSGTLKLLEMLSPAASSHLEKPAEKQEDRNAERMQGEEDERAKKRDALLQQLMRGENASPRRQPATNDRSPQTSKTGQDSTGNTAPASDVGQHPAIFRNQALYEAQKQQPSQPQLASYHGSPPMMHPSYTGGHIHFPPQPLLPQLPMLHPSQTAHQLKAAGHIPDYAPSPDIARASLLAMLSAGPIGARGPTPPGTLPPSQQQLQYPHPSLFPSQLPMGSSNGPHPPQFHPGGLPPPPWQQYPSQHSSHQLAFPPPVPQGAAPFYQMMPGTAHPLPLPGFAQAQMQQEQQYRSPQAQPHPGHSYHQTHIHAQQPPHISSTNDLASPPQSNANGPAAPMNNGNTGSLLALLNGA